MSDDPQTTISVADLQRLYATINAHETIIRILIRTLVDSAENPAKMFERLRSVTMDEGDLLCAGGSALSRRPSLPRTARFSKCNSTQQSDAILLKCGGL